MFIFFFSSRRRHTRCALVTGVQTCALPISPPRSHRRRPDRRGAPMFIVSHTELREAALGLLVSAGLPESQAEAAADGLVRADMRGVETHGEIGRASCRESVCQYGYISGGGASLKKQRYLDTCSTYILA